MTLTTTLHQEQTHALVKAPAPDWSLRVADATVLVVDDDEDVRDLVAFKLETAGYRTVTADNGNGALTVAHQQQPDVIVLDVVLPGMDGLSVCYQLHSDPMTAQIPVIMLSSRTEENDVQLGYTVGADHYMTKPFNPSHLVQRVRWLLLANGI